MRTRIARLLRRIAHKLSPLPTPAQIRQWRDYYDNHCSVTGEPMIGSAVSTALSVYSGPGQTASEVLAQMAAIPAGVPHGGW